MRKRPLSNILARLKEDRVKPGKRKDISDSFGSIHFFRTLSHREFFTSFSLALFLLALYSVVDYSDADWTISHEQTIKWVAIIVLLTLNHVVYRLEHRRSNTFMGRGIHDLIFIAMFASVTECRRLLSGPLEFDLTKTGTFIAAVLLIILLVYIYEMVIALIKGLLKMGGWQIL